MQEAETIALFKEYFRYDNGSIYWIKSRGTRGRVGTKAGKLRKDGYYDVGLFGKCYLVHRIIFAICNEILPDMVDHKDRNRANNIIDNLRVSDSSLNSWNSGISKANTTGVKGVRVKGDKFEARIAANKQTHQVGTFETLAEAQRAIADFRLRLHKEFTCNG